MEKIIKKLEDFVERRDWKIYHSPKNLAISISIEAAELLEHFQWNNQTFDSIQDKNNIKDEVADIMIYCLLFLNYMGSDIEDILIDKIHKNEVKYPI